MLKKEIDIMRFTKQNNNQVNTILEGLVLGFIL